MRRGKGDWCGIKGDPKQSIETEIRAKQRLLVIILWGTRKRAWKIRYEAISQRMKMQNREIC